uniref:Uncharacterized protein n=1 Tax=viral metagenome TaxID=1070528 RepID=A0A6C0CLR0_9ZZZZ
MTSTTTVFHIRDVLEHCDSCIEFSTAKNGKAGKTVTPYIRAVEHSPGKWRVATADDLKNKLQTELKPYLVKTPKLRPPKFGFYYPGPPKGERHYPLPEFVGDAKNKSRQFSITASLYGVDDPTNSNYARYNLVQDYYNMLDRKVKELIQSNSKALTGKATISDEGFDLLYSPCIKPGSERDDGTNWPGTIKFAMPGKAASNPDGIDFKFRFFDGNTGEAKDLSYLYNPTSGYPDSFEFVPVHFYKHIFIKAGNTPSMSNRFETAQLLIYKETRIDELVVDVNEPDESEFDDYTPSTGGASKSDAKPKPEPKAEPEAEPEPAPAKEPAKEKKTKSKTTKSKKKKEPTPPPKEPTPPPPESDSDSDSDSSSVGDSDSDSN